MIKPLFIILLSVLSNFLIGQYHIIPEPVSLTYHRTISTASAQVNVNIGTFSGAASYLVTALKNKGYKVNSTKSIITLIIKFEKDNVLSPEGYSINLTKNVLTLKASSDQGAFRGITTILQMASNPAQRWTDCSITDYPRFPWRGLMLDVSRHFFTVEDVKSYIDQMAHYKFNVFHWHLTDDEGWRIEIKSLPLLTKIGAWRSQGYGKFGSRPAPTKEDAKIYGGYYTQEQIKEVVAYAAERHITIVPEIDVPGHSMAFLAAYPQFSTMKKETYVSNGFKFSEWYGDGTFKMLVENTLDPSNDSLYIMLDKVFGEVATLFPGKYIHVGGDECYHGYWEADVNCKKFMENNQLKNSLELQSYFMKRVEKIISSKQKKMIGWDEILYGGLADGAAVMSWRGMKGGIEAARLGHEVVMTPTKFTYLDYTQGDHSIELPIYSDLSLKQSYSFDALPSDVDAKWILGGQGNLWTEQIPHLDHAYYMTYPRAMALSEALWSPLERKDWNRFTSKLSHHFNEFDNNKMQISRAVYDGVVTVYKEGEKLMCSLNCEWPGADIYYTVDNTFPNLHSTKYSVPFEIPNGELSLRVITYNNDRPLGRLLHISREELLRRAAKKR